MFVQCKSARPSHAITVIGRGDETTVIVARRSSESTTGSRASDPRKARRARIFRLPRSDLPKCAERHCTASSSGRTRSTGRPVLSPTSFACEYSTWFIRRHALRRSDLPARSPPLCANHTFYHTVCEPICGPTRARHLARPSDAIRHLERERAFLTISRSLNTERNNLPIRCYSKTATAAVWTANKVLKSIDYFVLAAK